MLCAVWNTSVGHKVTPSTHSDFLINTCFITMKVYLQFDVIEFAPVAARPQGSVWTPPPQLFSKKKKKHSGVTSSFLAIIHCCEWSRLVWVQWIEAAPVCKLCVTLLRPQAQILTVFCTSPLSLRSCHPSLHSAHTGTSSLRSTDDFHYSTQTPSQGG